MATTPTAQSGTGDEADERDEAEGLRAMLAEVVRDELGLLADSDEGREAAGELEATLLTRLSAEDSG